MYCPFQGQTNIISSDFFSFWELLAVERRRRINTYNIDHDKFCQRKEQVSWWKGSNHNVSSFHIAGGGVICVLSPYHIFRKKVFAIERKFEWNRFPIFIYFSKKSFEFIHLLQWSQSAIQNQVNVWNKSLLTSLAAHMLIAESYESSSDMRKENILSGVISNNCSMSLAYISLLEFRHWHKSLEEL